MDDTLYIVPTLTSDIIGQAAITDGYALNLTSEGICTSSNVSQCTAISNISTGSIINPVRSARLITKNKASLRYGKVEVEARMPTG
jgi:beta-glucanase (GH16 family)